MWLLYMILTFVDSLIRIVAHLTTGPGHFSNTKEAFQIFASEFLGRTISFVMSHLHTTCFLHKSFYNSSYHRWRSYYMHWCRHLAREVLLLCLEIFLIIKINACGTNSHSLCYDPRSMSLCDFRELFVWDLTNPFINAIRTIDMTRDRFARHSKLLTNRLWFISFFVDRNEITKM